MDRSASALGFPYATPAQRGDRPANAGDGFVRPAQGIAPVEIGGRLLETFSRPATASADVLCGPYPTLIELVVKATGDIVYISTVSTSGTSQAFRIEAGETTPKFVLPVGRRLYYVGGTAWVIVYG